MVTWNIREQRHEYKWELEFTSRDSENYVTNSVFLLLKIGNDILSFLVLILIQGSSYWLTLRSLSCNTVVKSWKV